MNRTTRHWIGMGWPVAAWVLALSAVPAAGEVRLPRIIGDHMVIQRGKALPIWGWADAGEEVTVTLGQVKAAATAGRDGRWRVTLPAMKAGGPHTMTVRGKNTLEVKDILVGEVWVCSGQSNMGFKVVRADGGKEEIATANHPRLRMFTVERAMADSPRDDCIGRWEVCSPETLGGFSAVGYFFGKELQDELDVPIGMINTSWGGTVCEAWTAREALEGDPDFETIVARPVAEGQEKNRASVLYNGMLAPLVPYTIRGVIWYQGESNVGRAFQYNRLFPSMIRNWRQVWGQGDFPFYYVQIAPYRYPQYEPQYCAELWEAQLKTLALPNTGMAVTMDIGNVANVHPTNKREVGRRLALWALSNTYGKHLVYSGPLYESMRIESDKIRVRFRHADGGLLAHGGGPLREFTIAGSDRKFYPATAVIDGESLLVSSPEVPRPVAVRFGWHDDAQPNLANRAGLPASPFRTDDWPAATADLK